MWWLLADNVMRKSSRIASRPLIRCAFDYRSYFQRPRLLCRPSRFRGETFAPSLSTLSSSSTLLHDCRGNNCQRHTRAVSVPVFGARANARFTGCAGQLNRSFVEAHILSRFRRPATVREVFFSSETVAKTFRFLRTYRNTGDFQQTVLRDPTLRTYLCVALKFR